MSEESVPVQSEPPTVSAMRQRPMRRAVFLGSIIALVLVLIVTVAVVVNTALQGSIGPGGLFALLMFGGVALVASLATTEVIPWGARTLDHWLQPKVLGALGMAMIIATGALFSLLPLLQTRTAPVVIEQRAAEAPQPSLIVQHIAGRWGRDGCARVYAIALNQGSLTIEFAGDSAAGMPPRDFEFSRKGDSDAARIGGVQRSTMVTEEVRGFFPGYAAEFTLETNGNRASDRLIWEHRGMFAAPLRLERCG
jgi:hypothetical protein